MGAASGMLNGRLNGFNAQLKKLEAYLDEHEFVAGMLRTAVIIIVILIIGALIYMYNTFSKLHTDILVSYAQIGVETKRRDNLIPNLIVTTKIYAIHEQKAFKYVSDAREMLSNAKNIRESEKLSANLDTALSKLFALFEQYPDLKATQSVQDLIKELANTENRIAEKKEQYNLAIYRYNALLLEFPSNFFGRLFGFWPPFEYCSIQEDKMQTPAVISEWNKISEGQHLTGDAPDTASPNALKNEKTINGGTFK